MRPGLRAHDDDARGQHQGLLDVVGDEHQNGPPLLPEVQEVVLQLGAGEGVERRKRLIEQQHRRPGDQRAGDGDALGLPAGELARPHRRPCRSAQRACKAAAIALGALRSGNVGQAEADVVGDAEPGQQPRLLKDEADLLVRGRR